MLSLYNSYNISRIDELTINSGITSLELINRASKAYVKWLLKYLEPSDHIQILCGQGNNGADGLAVALQLENRGFSVGILSLNFSSKSSDENKFYLSLVRRSKNIKVTLIEDKSDLAKIEKHGVIIDAILGNGINRKLSGNYLELVNFINRHFDRIYAVDTPTGLLDYPCTTSSATEAIRTFSFQFPKLSFFAPEHERFIGNWDYKDIGLKAHLLKSHPEKFFLIEKCDVDKILRARPSFTHKGLVGKALFILGMDNMIGASLLSARACLNMGAGYTYCYVEDELPGNYSISQPEIIFNNELESMLAMNPNTLCIGPGLGLVNSAKNTLLATLNCSVQYRIFDADALTLIAINKWQNIVPSGSIITPHIGEFEILFGKHHTHSERIEEQRKQSIQLGIFIILKGRFTSISDPSGNIYYNRTGNPSLAKGGTGDILCGILTSLSAQGYPTLQVCMLGVYLHGLAADIFVESHHEINLTPHKLIDNLPIALKSLN